MNGEEINGSSSDEIPPEYIQSLVTHNVPRGRKAWKNRESAELRKAREARKRLARQIIMHTIMEGDRHMYPQKENYEVEEREEDSFMKAFRERCIQNRKKKSPKVMKPNRDPLPENQKADILMKKFKDYCVSQRAGNSKHAKVRGKRNVKKLTHPKTNSTVPGASEVARPSTSMAKPTMADLKKKIAAKRKAEARIVMRPQPKAERIGNEFLKLLLSRKDSSQNYRKNQENNLLARILESERKEREANLTDPELLEATQENDGSDYDYDADPYPGVNPDALADYLSSVNDQIDGEHSLAEFLATIKFEDSSEEESESAVEKESEVIDVSKWSPNLQELFANYVSCRPDIEVDYDGNSD